MPSEKFHQPASETEGPGGTFEVVWGSGADGVEVYVYSYAFGENGRPFEIHSFTPDRDDLNRLIRSLRRARNAKYGSDE